MVALHEEGWSDTSIERYLEVDRLTVYRVRKRCEEELRDRPGGRPRGVERHNTRGHHAHEDRMTVGAATRGCWAP